MATDGGNDEQAVAQRLIEQMGAADRRFVEQRQEAIRRQVDVDRMWRDVAAGKPFELPPKTTEQPETPAEVPSGVS